MIANAIKKVTKNPYSHSSISFDSSLQNMYSFGRKYKNSPLIGTFVKEDITSGFYEDVRDTTTYSLYVTFVTKEERDMMMQKLSYFQDNKGFKYDFIGLLKHGFGKISEREDAYFCSGFVATILASGTDIFNKHYSLVKPYDFAKSKRFQFVTKGLLKNYSESKVKSIVSQLYRGVELVTEASSEQNELVRWHMGFYPSYTPQEMLEQGVFGNHYLSEKDKSELPSSWFKNLPDGEGKDINKYGVESGMTKKEWEEKGWIEDIDPKGWFQWYCRYFEGRRSYDDQRQIKRWKSYVSRHGAQVYKSCGTDQQCRPTQRQGLLQWAWDSNKNPMSNSTAETNIRKMLKASAKPTKYVDK